MNTASYAVRNSPPNKNNAKIHFASKRQIFKCQYFRLYGKTCSFLRGTVSVNIYAEFTYIP